jgi:hypothetical protein
MTRGNRAIRDRPEDGKRLHLFEALGEGQVRYIGRATYLDHHREDRPDAYGEMRSAIVFELVVNPTEDQDADDVEEQVEESGGSNQRWWTRPQDELRALALQEFYLISLRRRSETAELSAVQSCTDLRQETCRRGLRGVWQRGTVRHSTGTTVLRGPSRPPSLRWRPGSSPMGHCAVSELSPAGTP